MYVVEYSLWRADLLKGCNALPLLFFMCCLQRATVYLAEQQPLWTQVVTTE